MSELYRFRARIALSLAVAVVAAIPAAGLATAHAEPPAGALQAQPLTPRVSSSPFSSPKWLPFRQATRVGCTFHNPGCNPGHKKWALDFGGKLGQPIYAAGAGIAHVGGLFPGCRPGSSAKYAQRGNWVWIDHGAAEASFYYHLQDITISDGQSVTPSSQIGTMGVSGGAKACDSPQTHFYVLRADQNIDPGQLWACTGSRVIQYPAAIGFSSWSQVPRDSSQVSSDGVDCRQDPARAGAPASAVARKVGKRAIKLSWTPPTQNPSAVVAYWVSIRKRNGNHWAKRFTYRQVGPGQLSKKFGGLSPYGKYELRVAAFDTEGASPWAVKTKKLHP